MKNSDNSIFDYNSEDVRSGRIETADSGSGKAAGVVPSKKIYIIAVAVLSAILAIWLIFAAVNRINEGLVLELQVGDVQPYYYEDGTYSGTYSSGNMAAAVTVTVESGYIVDIALTGFERIDTARADRVFRAVIYAQSLVTYDEEVGTQPTDVILLLAVQNAFEGGLQI